MDLADLTRRMHGAVSVLKTELAGLRTGRASVSLIEPITVAAYGSTMPINQLASISVPEPRMLSVQVWDRTTVQAVDRAIREANLGLNPILEGQLLRIPIPELNAERRQELVKVAHYRHAGLIVMGLHGSPPLGPRMGSVTYRLLCLSQVLVLALPPGLPAPALDADAGVAERSAAAASQQAAEERPA